MLHNKAFPADAKSRAAEKQRYKHMKFAHLGKDKSIKELLTKLCEWLGKNSFDLVDHWEDDITAIGIGSPTNHKILVYISTYGNKEGFYDIHLELPALDENNFPYTNAGQFTSVSFEEAAKLIRDHLKKGSL